jgi:saccharopine dehydrogenase (NAD+, L-lysine-forming)
MYKKCNTLFIRKETYNNELRCPIVPNDIKILIDYGYKVIVESSIDRCYNNKQYEDYGAIIVNDSWYNYSDCLIIGIKELNNIEKLNKHIHIYFSHSYKNQINSKLILSLFKKSNSILYDLEYFIENNKRIISFSFYAGFIGCGLGLLQYLLKINNKKLVNLIYWNSIQDLINNIKFYNIENLNKIQICIIGSNGKCGNGAKNLLNLLELNYICIDKTDNKKSLYNYDIILNCINLQDNIGTWFDYDTPYYKNNVIVDISCDYNNLYNPIKIYNNKTTWLEPVYSFNNFVDIIAIDNLPSLLPFESSIEFSHKLVNLLKMYKNDDINWKNTFNIFKDKINNI